MNTLEDLRSQLEQMQLERFHPSQYPYDYAYDLLRTGALTKVVPGEVFRQCRLDPGASAHCEGYPWLFGVAEAPNRAEASMIVAVWANMMGCYRRELYELLADTYLRLQGIERPN